MKIKKIVLLAVLFISVSINSTAYPLSSDSPESYESLSETINALDITRSKYQTNLFLQNSTIKKEHSIFIDYLSLQINDYCSRVITLYGEQSLNKLPCSSNTMLDYSDGYQTSEEKIESLDNEFMIALGEFDEMLLIEDENLAQIKQNKSNSSNGSSQAQAHGQGQNETQGEYKQQTDQSVEANTNGLPDNDKRRKSSQSKSSSSNNSKGRGSKQKSANKSKERKRLDKIDDDIVARQLKEAAENENDPELKEKLWDEYYKYKQSIGS